MKKIPTKNQKEPTEYLLSDEKFAALHELGIILKTIFRRMQRDGYRMVDGKIVPPPNHDKEEKRNRRSKADTKRHVPRVLPDIQS